MITKHLLFVCFWGFSWVFFPLHSISQNRYGVITSDWLNPRLPKTGPVVVYGDANYLIEAYNHFKEYIKSPSHYIEYKGKSYLYSNLDTLVTELLIDSVLNNKGERLKSPSIDEKFSINKEYSFEIQSLIKSYIDEHNDTIRVTLEQSLVKMISDVEIGYERFYLECKFFEAHLLGVSDYVTYYSQIEQFFQYMKRVIKETNEASFEYAHKTYQRNGIGYAWYVDEDEFYEVCMLLANTFQSLDQNAKSTFFLLQAALYYVNKKKTFSGMSDIYYSIARNLHNSTTKRMEGKAFEYYYDALEPASELNQKTSIFYTIHALIYLSFNYSARYNQNRIDDGILYNMHIQLDGWLHEDSIQYYKRNAFLTFLNIAMLAQHQLDYELAKPYFQLAFIYRTLYSSKRIDFDVNNLMQIHGYLNDTLAISFFQKIMKNEWSRLNSPYTIATAISCAKGEVADRRYNSAKQLIAEIESKMQLGLLSISEKDRINYNIAGLKTSLYTALNEKDSAAFYSNVLSDYQTYYDNQADSISIYEQEFAISKLGAPLMDSLSFKADELQDRTSAVRVAYEEAEVAKRKVDLLNIEIARKSKRIEADSMAILSQLARLKVINEKNGNLKDDSIALTKQVSLQKRKVDELGAEKNAIVKNTKYLENVQFILWLTIIALTLFAVLIGFISYKKIGKLRATQEKLADDIQQRTFQINELNNIIAGKEEEARRLAKENYENNYKLKLEKEVAKQKLLSTLAINHDIDKFIPLLPDYISKAMPRDKGCLISVTKLFSQYHSLTKRIGNSLTNTVKQEIEIADKSASVYLYMAERTLKVAITTNFYGNHEIENLSIPKNMITGLIANSVKHGSIDKNILHVSVNAYVQQNGIKFEIEDDGNGFTTLNLENKEEDKGINLILNQVKTYNELDFDYTLDFESNNIVSKPNHGGVVNTFYLHKK